MPLFACEKYAPQRLSQRYRKMESQVLSFAIAEDKRAFGRPPAADSL
jgi:hypothetical protein